MDTQVASLAAKTNAVLDARKAEFVADGLSDVVVSEKAEAVLAQTQQLVAQKVAVSDDPLKPLADIAARLQAGVVAQVKKCANNWCRVTGSGFDGWIEQQRLWGVYADEKVD